MTDTVASAKKVIKTLNNLFRENGSINFLKTFFAVRRIITILFAIIKGQFNTLRFAKILSKVFVPFIFNEKNTVMIV